MLAGDELEAALSATLPPSSRAGKKWYAPEHCAAKPAAAQDRNTKVDYQHAQKCLERAIEHDPGLAQAHHHLSLVKFFLWMERWADDLDKVFAEALQAAREAFARDDTDSMVHAHLGMLHMHRREFDEAGVRFTEALRLNPNDSRALGLCGLYLAAIGRAEQGSSSSSGQSG